MNIKHNPPTFASRYNKLISAARDHEKSASGKPLLIGVDRAALEGNVGAIGKRIENRSLCAVLKGDAYGHGIENVLPFIKSHCSHIAVADNSEIEKVHAVVPALPIIRLRAGSPAEINEAVALSWIFTSALMSLIWEETV